MLTGENGANGANGANGTNGTNGANGISSYLYNTFLSAASTPGTPTGGSYTFSTATGIPPTGWSNFPVASGNNAVYVSTASVSTTTPTVPVTALTWSAPTQFTGGNGTPGPRGFLPMAYVLTPSTPVGATNANLTTWFQSSRENTVAPIGTGYVPVSGDVAAFTLTGNANVVVVNTFDATTQTWAAAPGQVLNGNVFITGSVNASKLAANDIYTLKLQSTNATFGSPTGFGFWLDAASGNAYMANTVTIGNQLRVGNTANIGTNLTVGANATIGNNLIVGNNAQIGGNLTIGGLTTNGTLNPNVVTNTAIASGVDGGKLQSGTVTAAQIAAGTITATQISAAYVYAGNIISTNAANSFPNINSPGYWLRYDTGDARFGGNVSIGNNLTVGNLITTSTLNANTVTYDNIVAGTVPPPQGAGFYAPSSLTLNSAAAYDGLYTSGSVFGYYKTLQYITIPVTSSMAALTSAAPLQFQCSFRAQVVASGVLSSSSGPLFYVFTNQQQSTTTYGGSGQLQAIPFNATPVPAGGSNNPGSLLGPQFGRVLATGGGTSFTGTLSFGASTQSPYSTGTLVNGSTIVIGVVMFNAVNPAQLGQVALTNMAFNVILK